MLVSEMSESDQQSEGKIRGGSTFNGNSHRRIIEFPGILVASIDHIREKIFTHLSVQDLKTCRLVCQHWDICGSHELQKRAKVTFYTNYKRISDDHYFQAYHYSKLALVSSSLFFKGRQVEIRRSLQQLTALLDQTKITPIPSSTFEFLESQLPVSPDIDDFLTLHGHHIKSLFLHFKSFMPETSVQCQLDSLTKVLTEQTPNLHKLKLRIPLWYYDARRDPVKYQREGDKDKLKYSNLKIVDLHTERPLTVFKWICEIAPGLQEIQLFPRDFYLLLPPMENRVHLLKRLCFSPSEKSLNILEKIVEASLSNDKGGLQLQELSLSLGWVYGNPESWRRIMSLLKQIFQNSSNSLETIRWSRMGFLWGFEIPTLSKLHTLEIGYDNLPAFRRQGFFPPAMNLLEAFPRLRAIRLCKGCLDFKVASSDDDEEEEDVGSGLLFPSDLETYQYTVSTVRYLYLEEAKDYPEKFVQSLKQWFPNARIINVS